ncbi:hypothetical protein PWT90_05808 [Aphanocladium album]|nr:hypothetical protein PWT90_05808 [Aphanocladium album]
MKNYIYLVNVAVGGGGGGSGAAAAAAAQASEARDLTGLLSAAKIVTTSVMVKPVNKKQFGVMGGVIVELYSFTPLKIGADATNGSDTRLLAGRVLWWLGSMPD